MSDTPKHDDMQVRHAAGVQSDFVGLCCGGQSNFPVKESTLRMYLMQHLAARMAFAPCTVQRQPPNRSLHENHANQRI